MGASGRDQKAITRQHYQGRAGHKDFEFLRELKRYDKAKHEKEEYMTHAFAGLRRAGRWAAVSSVLAAGMIMPAKPAQAQSAQTKKPNIVIIWGDDIGQSDISAYSMGLMGFRTPNIDRVAREGMIFTDYYAEQSCTAGRASFITGQSGLRTGLTKVGLPGATVGLQKEDPTIAELLKAQGYATGQFGKNHLGDRNEYLPTVHGFDEFYGNLYHLNAEEEPELPDYPKDPAFRAKFGPRGVMDCKASDTDDHDCGSALRQGRQAGLQGHRSADQEADGNDRR